jgi:cell division protein FtsZ
VLDAFKAADQVLLSGVQGITDLITTPGLINLDFADVKSVMSGAGSALMGIGSARGDDRSVAAAEAAISSPLLEASIDGAHGVLLSIQGGSDLGLFEINEAAQLVSNSAAPDANIIFGAVIDDALGDEVRVTVIAAGFDEPQDERPRAGRGAVGGGTFTLPAPVPAQAPSAPPASSSWLPAAPAERPAPASLPHAAPVAQAAAPPSGSYAETDHGSSEDSGSGSGGSGTGDSPAPAEPGAGSSYSAASSLTASSGTGGGSGSHESATADSVPAPRPAERDAPSGPDKPAVSAARPADPPRLGETTSTRRRSVVFEEEDELDVPDFLK